MTIEYPPSLNLISPRALLQGAGNPDALENVNPGILPDGALCWVINQQEIYYLDKTSTAAVSAPDVIATVLGAGTPGRWILNATAGPPSGAAGGDLAGTYPNPEVRGFHETGGPTQLLFGAIAAGQRLTRTGGAVVSGDFVFTNVTLQNAARADVDLSTQTGIITLNTDTIPANSGGVATWLILYDVGCFTDSLGPSVFMQVDGVTTRALDYLPSQNTAFGGMIVVQGTASPIPILQRVVLGANTQAEFKAPQILRVRIN